ncbi:MAG: GTP-binding protein [Planctomycetales bacterium]
MIALAKARTERAAGILLDQQQGTLRRELEQIQQEASEGKTESARARTHALLDRARLGLRLTEPFRVALAGRPNVGKSSLVNAWLGYERSIVFDQPGTTRDVVAATASVDGWLIELSDTAGLRETRDPLEAAGARLTERRLESVDLVVLILDAAEPPTPEDQALLAAWPDALRVANKCDLPAADASRISGSIPVSALTGEGMDALLRAVSLRLVPEPPSPGAAVPFTVGQAEDLCELLDALDGGNVALADQLLTRMTRGN